MIHLLNLAIKSMWNRKLSISLMLASGTLSIFLLLAVEKVRIGAYEGFKNTLSGTDLIVGGRTGPINLLLYSVFRIGSPTNNISWKSYQWLQEHEEIEWIVPISLGDSFKGFRVVGTTDSYFEHYRYGDSRKLALAKGKLFHSPFEVVLGSTVAKKQELKVGDSVILSHGLGGGFQKHKENPFTVVGVLSPTGTPVDKAVHVSLLGLEAIHIGWRDDKRNELDHSLESITPEAVTALLVGLRSKLGIFQVQREVNTFKSEPLLAILPGVTISELWSLVSVAEEALRLVALCVFIAALFGIIASMLTTLQERRREMAILRSVGAKPHQISLLLLFESGTISFLSCVLGTLILSVGIFVFSDTFQELLGLRLHWSFTWHDCFLLLVFFLIGTLSGVIPALQAYRTSLQDGLMIRV